MSNEKPEPVAKKKTARSPSNPYVNLRVAVDRARDFYEQEKQNSAPKNVALSHWNYTEKSSGGLRTLAALKAYGLVSISAGRVALTQRALRIVVPGSPDRDQALREAALSPTEFKWMWDKYQTNLPSQDTLNHELVIDRGYTEAAAGDFVDKYKATISYSKMEESARMAVSSEDSGKTSVSEPGAAMDSQGTPEAPPSPPSPQTPSALTGSCLPPVTFPLPRGNMVEIRLKSRVTSKEFDQLKQLLDLLGPSLIEGEGV